MFRIFGPPGTGKTTTLLNMVDKALSEGIKPDRIAFLAFTKKAANEAKDRACQRFSLDPKKDLFYFRTLHSFALSLSDIRAEQIMGPENYKELGVAIGMDLSGEREISIDEYTPSTLDKNPVLALINLSRLRKVSLREQYDKGDLSESWVTVKYINDALLAYKQARGLYDFTDMLEIFLGQAEECCPRFDLVFLDEAQDLSPLQWDVAHVLDGRASRMYCAGDDDQAIFRWAGADVDHFIHLPGGAEVLSQSYRIPRSVHRVAESIVRRIKRRFPKVYDPQEKPGSVQRVTGMYDLDLSEGSWLILAQAQYMLQPVAAELRMRGHLFMHRGQPSVSEKIREAINGWENLRKGKEVEGSVARNIYSYMSSGTRIKKGYKKINGLADEDLVDMEALVRHHGLLVTDEIWSEAMDKLPAVDKAYITAALRRGEKFNAVPRITISTIHGSKGGEADNVILFTDISTAADKARSLDPDDMHRVFYVGVTRARENLYIVDPENLNRCYDI
jgi:DNA helicase-2/ATP-dependent DNA helicase PcrA